MERPIKRSAIRQKIGEFYYSLKRKHLWFKMNKTFSSHISNDRLPCKCFSHKTILLRKLKDVDMWMQENKIINLKIAAKKLNGIIIKPGEIFSYWKIIGNPTKRKGYVKGMILKNGTFVSGTGGGLCQMSNLIFWMTMHTPLSIVERHRHGYDVFPDSNRTQPFGSGATCFYPHGDLMMQNTTTEDYQLIINVGNEYLEGEWRCVYKNEYTYKVVERNHKMKSEFWGGYSRHNELYQQIFSKDNEIVEENLIVQNSALMMYSPFIASSSSIKNR